MEELQRINFAKIMQSSWISANNNKILKTSDFYSHHKIKPRVTRMNIQILLRRSMRQLKLFNMPKLKVSSRQPQKNNLIF